MPDTRMRLTGTLVGATGDSRELRYRLLPYGEPGYTNLGTITASKGVLAVPDPATFHVNISHDRDRPAAVGVSFEDTDEALFATIRPLDTTAGNDLLVEAREGVRKGISVEIENPVVHNGNLHAGDLAAAGAVVQPAWENALLVAEAATPAPDMGEFHSAPSETEGGDEDEDQADEHVDQTGVSAPEDDNPTEEIEMPETETPTTEARVPALVANRAQPPATPAPLTLRGAAALIIAMKSGDTAAAAQLVGAARLFGALDNFTAAEGEASVVPQWVGELWDGQPYTRRVIPVLSSDTLTSMTVKGWSWKTPPTVEKYAGLPAEINSTAVEIEPVEEDATRWAGGGRIDRRYTDFNDSAVLASYLSKLAEDYARKTDLDCAAFLLAESTDVTPGTVPAGVAPGLAAIVDGALSFIDMANPGFALCDKATYRDIILMRSEDALAFLSASLGLDEGTFAGFRVVPVASYPAKTVVVGAREAATHRELPGSPIRVNAQAIAVGAIDEAVFGYDHTLINDARALAKVELA